MSQRCLALLFVAFMSAALAAAPGTQHDSPPGCIAVMLPSVQGAEGSATEVGGGIRDLFTSFLNGPSIRAIALDARLASQALDEATQKGCTQVLSSVVTIRHGGGRLGRAVGQGIGAAAWYAPLPAGGGAAAAAVRSAAIGGAQAVSTLAASTRAKDDMELEYRLLAAGNATGATAHTEKAKARADREDLLTPLVERAAKAIAAAVEPVRR